MNLLDFIEWSSLNESEGGVYYTFKYDKYGGPLGFTRPDELEQLLKENIKSYTIDINTLSSNFRVDTNQSLEVTFTPIEEDEDSMFSILEIGKPVKLPIKNSGQVELEIPLTLDSISQRSIMDASAHLAAINSKDYRVIKAKERNEFVVYSKRNIDDFIDIVAKYLANGIKQSGSFEMAFVKDRMTLPPLPTDADIDKISLERNEKVKADNELELMLKIQINLRYRVLLKIMKEMLVSTRESADSTKASELAERVKVFLDNLQRTRPEERDELYQENFDLLKDLLFASDENSSHLNNVSYLLSDMFRALLNDVGSNKELMLLFANKFK
jgi:hypothetical protein